MSDLFIDEPIQLISYNEDGFFEITNNGFNWLNELLNIDNIQILSIIGPKKSGKTFLLNSLMKNIKGFKYEDIKGIWVWGKPIDLDNGNKLILIDTEGIENFDNENIRIIVNLLKCISSIIIYHIKGNINNDEIINNFSKLLCIKDNIIISDNDIKNLSNIIFTLGNYVNTEKNVKDYINGFLDLNDKNEDIKKYYPNMKYFYIPVPILDEEKIKNLENEEISSLNPEYLKIIDEIFNENKNILKKLNGNYLFYIIQNYINSCNNKEIYDVSKGLNNIYGVESKKIMEDVFSDFKNEIKIKFENAFPLNFDDIYKIFYELIIKETNNFCSKIKNINPIDIGQFLNKLYKRMWGEIESIIIKNMKYYNFWLNNLYIEFENNLKSISFDKKNQIKKFFSNYLNVYKNLSLKFLEMPNNDFVKNLIQVFNNINQIFIYDKFLLISEEIEDNFDNLQKKNTSEIDDLKNSLIKLNEELQMTKNTLETKTKEKNDLNHSYLELDNKFDKINRESVIKEKEYQNNIEVETQKFQKMELYYTKEISEKESLITSLEFKIEKLTQKIDELTKESSRIKNELNREIIKLNVEIETLRRNSSKSKFDLFDITKPNLQTVLKTVQNSLNDFKERIEKLDKKNSNLSESNFIEQSTQEIENKSKIWIEEIKNYKDEELKKINENYENNIKKTKEQIEELSFEITKKNYIIEEQKEMKNTYDIKINETKNQIQQLNEMIQSKEDVIKSKDDCLKAYNEKIESHKTRIEDLEMQLNSKIINLKMKEVELESVIDLIGFIAEKKKDKIKKALTSISSENQEYISNLLKKMGLIK